MWLTLHQCTHPINIKYPTLVRLFILYCGREKSIRALISKNCFYKRVNEKYKFWCDTHARTKAVVIMIGCFLSLLFSPFLLSLLLLFLLLSTINLSRLHKMEFWSIFWIDAMSGRPDIIFVLCSSYIFFQWLIMKRPKHLRVHFKMTLLYFNFSGVKINS